MVILSYIKVQLQFGDDEICYSFTAPLSVFYDLLCFGPARICAQDVLGETGLPQTCRICLNSVADIYALKNAVAAVGEKSIFD